MVTTKPLIAEHIGEQNSQ